MSTTSTTPAPRCVKFGEAIRARARGEEPEEYSGAYVSELAERIDGAAEGDPDEVAQRGIALMLEGVRATLARFRVHMDRFFSERSLHDRARWTGARRARPAVYEHDGARLAAHHRRRATTRTACCGAPPAS